MDPETEIVEQEFKANEEKKKKFEELLRRKKEIENMKGDLELYNGEKETYKYETITRNKKRKETTKEKIFNNAFCVEIKEEEEKVMRKLGSPKQRHEGTWLDTLLEKEKKMKREENRLAQDRLKMIDKRTRYADLVREVLSPTTRAKITPEPKLLPKSLSKNELVNIDDKNSTNPSERSKVPQSENGVEFVRGELLKKRMTVRSQSRKETSPYNVHQKISRSPFPRQTGIPVRDVYN